MTGLVDRNSGQQGNKGQRQKTAAVPRGWKRGSWRQGWCSEGRRQGEMAAADGGIPSHCALGHARDPPSDSSHPAGSSPLAAHLQPRCTMLFLTSAPNFATERRGGLCGAAGPSKGKGGKGLREKGPEGPAGTTSAFCSRRLGPRARAGRAVHTASDASDQQDRKGNGSLTWGQPRQDRLHTPEPLSRSAATSAENAGGPVGVALPTEGSTQREQGALPSPREKRGQLPTGRSAEGSGCLRRRCHPQLKTTQKLQELLAPRGPSAERGGPWGPPQTGAPVGGPGDTCYTGGVRPSPLWGGKQRPSQCPQERATATWPSEGPSPWNASSSVFLVCLGQPTSNTLHPQVTYQPQNRQLMKQTSQLPSVWGLRPLVIGSVSLSWGSPLQGVRPKESCPLGPLPADSCLRSHILDFV